MEILSMKDSLFDAFISLADQQMEKCEINRKTIFPVINGEKVLDKITVTKITKVAHCNRRTFYTYFHDVYDLFDQLESMYLENLEKYVDEWNKRAITKPLIVDLVRNVIDYIAKHAEGVKVVGTIDNVIFNQLLQKAIMEIIVKDSPVFKDQDQADRKYTITFLASGFAWVCYRWLLNPDEISTDKLKELVAVYFVNVYDILENGMLDDLGKLFSINHD